MMQDIYHFYLIPNFAAYSNNWVNTIYETPVFNAARKSSTCILANYYCDNFIQEHTHYGLSIKYTSFKVQSRNYPTICSHGHEFDVKLQDLD